jgi:hypothetical protein
MVTLRKYKLRPTSVAGAFVLLLSCPTITSNRHISEAIVNAMGVIIHAARAALPMPDFANHIRKFSA